MDDKNNDNYEKAFRDEYEEAENKAVAWVVAHPKTAVLAILIGFAAITVLVLR